MPPSDDLFTYRSGFDRPVIGMESEFTLFLDGTETPPENIWRHPSEFITAPLLKRSTKASQLPGGGALYFDGGVLELVTPVIELERGSTARMVRSMWEQIGFIRDELDKWEKRSGHHVQLQAFSSHYNISFELGREERGRDRTIQSLSLLLAYLLPVPVLVVAANRRSSGVGVRPRRDRIEVTVDFTPDPGLTLATAALLVGVTREVISWPSYRVEMLDEHGLPLLADMEPGRHTSRKGWLVGAGNFRRDPSRINLDAPVWATHHHGNVSLRRIALDVTRHFRKSIEGVSDPFSTQLLFSVLEGRTHSMLELEQRPTAYDDIGRLVQWGSSIPELDNYSDEIEHVTGRRLRRGSDAVVALDAPWTQADSERRHMDHEAIEPGRRRRDRRESQVVATDAPLSRSRYEQVFMDLVAGKPVHFNGRTLAPVRMKGWYEAVFRDVNSGEEQVISIERLAGRRRN
jgi:hypothetical protein